MAGHRHETPDDIEQKKALALTKAGLDCANWLGLSPAEICAVLGIQQGALQAMKKGERSVDGRSGEAERADGLVRIVKRLRKLLGDAETNARSWLRRENAKLEDKPVAIMMQRDGVLKVATFLEQQGEL